MYSLTDIPQQSIGLKVTLSMIQTCIRFSRYIISEHNFYLCELDIKNIFVLDFYGGPHQVNASDYYAIHL